MKLVVRDLDPRNVLALTEHLAPLANVSVGSGDLLNAGVDSVVLPIQSYTTLDMGLLARCRATIGTRTWSRLNVIVNRRFGGAIPVGEAVAVSTGMAGLSWVIAAPVQHRALFVGPEVHSDQYGRAIVPGGRALTRDGLGGVLEQQTDARPQVSIVQGVERALLAALQVAKELPISHLGCPGLGTGGAGGNPERCAAAMARAWAAFDESGIVSG